MSDNLEILKTFPDLKTVPENEIKWILEHGEIGWHKKGEEAFKPGEPIDRMFLMLSGRLSFRREQNGQFKEIAQIKEKDIFGLLPYSRATNAIGFGYFLEDSEVIILNAQQLDVLKRDCPKLVEALVHRLLNRVRRFTERSSLNDKLTALGKLSAGLAHELNNPSAAVVRSARALKKHIGTVPEKFKQVMLIKVTPEVVDKVNDVLFSRIEQLGNQTLSLMERTALEDDLADWLEDREVDEALDKAVVLAEFQFSEDDLENILEWVGEPYFNAVIGWVESVLNSEKLVEEIENASERISKLVKSVKTYTHMDQAEDIHPANLLEGINSTLTMLGHKIRGNSITVKIDFPEDFPEVKVMVSEMNQVWTNLIDNAIDAMGKNGELEIRGTKESECIEIAIIDNGPGIPEDIKNQIFDPFFTTKSVGEGTGLGLDIVQKIVSQHKGDILVESKPGRTEFLIRLPL